MSTELTPPSGGERVLDATHVDHIVVGAGSAGCVVAAVLSTDPSRTVLLLEAGPDRAGSRTGPKGPAGSTGPTADATRSPNLFQAISVPGRTWARITATRAPGLAARPYTRGLGVGGSGAVNGLVAVPGRPEDYDRWARDLGCEGWAWSDVGPTFAALRRTLRAQSTDRWQASDRALALAGRSLGLPLLSASKAWTTDGVGPALLSVTATTDPAVSDAVASDPVAGALLRGSSDVSHLAVARRRPNLGVRTGTEVERLLVDGRRIAGVRLTDGTEITASHVTVCAGAILSPALLLRSGIEREAIGKNLIDHPAVGVTLTLHESADMTCPSTAALLQTDGIQVLPISGLGLGDEERRLGAFMAAVLRSYGRGEITLRADDPFGPPIVAFDLLGDERDVAALRRATRLLVALASSAALATEVASVLIDDRGTPIDTLVDADDSTVDTWIRNSLADYLHVAGTCRMGAATDNAAVVDTACRVIGYAGLSVIDASVFPDLPQANPNLPTLMVATRAAERLRAQA